MRLALAFAVLLGVLAACGATAGNPLLGHYRAVLQLPGGELPFGLEIGKDADALFAVLINGSERIRVPEVTLQGDEITLVMPGFENRIVAKRNGNGLAGTLTMIKARGKRQEVAFAAERGKDYRFFEKPQPDAEVADISGRWAVTFTSDEDKESIAVGEFTQIGSQVEGTFLTPSGDHRFLSGEVRDGQLHLGTFNGGQAFLYSARIDGSGVMSGDFWSGLASHERFTARHDDAASLGDSTSATVLRKDAGRFAFQFPDLDGKAVSLADERFRGKVVVVALSGSWCPNCHDEAAFLAPYYAAHRAEGLEVIGLMFEQFEAFPEAVAAIRRFRQKFDIQYPLLVAGVTADDDASKKLPQLNAVRAYPTTLLIDRKGEVRRIHMGFSGPATGVHYTDLTRDLDHSIRELLAEKG